MRLAGRAWGGLPVTGRGARMTGIRRQKAPALARSEQAASAALLAGSPSRWPVTRVTGTGEARARASRPYATGRSQRPAAVGRAGPFGPEEHTVARHCVTP